MKRLQVVQWAVAGALLCGGVLTARIAGASGCYQAFEGYGIFGCMSAADCQQNGLPPGGALWGDYQWYANDGTFIETATGSDGTRQLAVNLQGQLAGNPKIAYPNQPWSGYSCVEAWGLDARYNIKCYNYDNTNDGNSVTDYTGDCNGSTNVYAVAWFGEVLNCGNGGPPCPDGKSSCEPSETGPYPVCLH